MQFTKPMIELVLEIRRRVPASMKPEVKLANPELFNTLHMFYHSKPNAISTALIKELFVLAGPSWEQLLRSPMPSVKKTTVSVYRGNIKHEKKHEDPKNIDASTKTKRIYRGQVVG